MASRILSTPEIRNRRHYRKAMGNTAYMLMTGAWGWFGFIIQNPDVASLNALLSKANVGAKNWGEYRGTFEIVDGPTEDYPEEGDNDGSWVSVSNQDLEAALNKYVGGDVSALDYLGR
jgi:hypothetical protein